MLIPTFSADVNFVDKLLYRCY